VKISGGTVPIGGEVSGGGGYSSAAHLADSGLPIPQEVLDAAAACVTDTDEIALFNPGRKVINAEPAADSALDSCQSGANPA
jgi:hypothetical protein